MTEHAPPYPLVSYHGGHAFFDGRGEPEAFVEAAIRQGFAAFGFSEHMPPPEPYAYVDFPPHADAMRVFDHYVERVTRLQTAYRDDLPILVGVETEYLPDQETYVADFIESYPFDYVVGSVHYVRGMIIDCSAEGHRQVVDACGGMEEMVEEYYRVVRGMLAMGVADVLGHLDLVKIFAGGLPKTPRIRDAERETLDAAMRAGVILDVNARGLRKPCREVYPGPELLAAARAMGLPATLGDDSHAPDQVGLGLDQAAAAMRAAGYEAITALLLDGNLVVRRELSMSIAS